MYFAKSILYGQFFNGIMYERAKDGSLSVTVGQPILTDHLAQSERNSAGCKIPLADELVAMLARDTSGMITGGKLVKAGNDFRIEPPSDEALILFCSQSSTGGRWKLPPDNVAYQRKVHHRDELVLCTQYALAALKPGEFIKLTRKNPRPSSPGGVLVENGDVDWLEISETVSFDGVQVEYRHSTQL